MIDLQRSNARFANRKPADRQRSNGEDAKRNRSTRDR
jgi:hypothetical protein